METLALASPDAALEALQHGHRFDLAIFDNLVDETPGEELASRVRGLETARDLPLVLLAPLGYRESTPGLFASRLVKPLKASYLLDTLVTLLSGPGDLDGPQPAGPPSTRSASQLRVLLVEDNPVNQKLATRLLEKLEVRVDLAGNGVECLQALDRQPYDLVFMDIQMPEMDGLEATRRIRAQRNGARSPYIVAMTANAMQGDREACIEAGMNDYVSKPIRPDSLAAALARASDAIGESVAER